MHACLYPCSTTNWDKIIFNSIKMTIQTTCYLESICFDCNLSDNLILGLLKVYRGKVCITLKPRTRLSNKDILLVCFPLPFVQDQEEMSEKRVASLEWHRQKKQTYFQKDVLYKTFSLIFAQRVESESISLYTWTKLMFSNRNAVC